MIRLISFLLLVTFLSLGLAWIADQPGQVAVAWAEYRFETTIPILIAGIAVSAFLCMLFYSLLKALLLSPRTWSRTRAARRQTLGLEALTEAFAAIATQDIAGARKYISRAQQLLPKQPLTLMLSAQAARLEGNESQARLYLEQMLTTEGTEFMALRGLVEAARKRGDVEGAINYGEKALLLKPQDHWLIVTLVGLYAKQEQTQSAIRLIELSARKRYLEKQEARELSAYVLFENARVLVSQRRSDFAIAVLEDILRKLPGFAPAGALLAESYLKQDEPKRALKAINNVWKIAPHPALTDALMLCYESDKDTKRVTQAIEKNATIFPEQRESQFLLARLASKRRDWETARRHLTHLINDKETVRACTLMAEIENAREDHEKAAYWLKQASIAASDAIWTCSSCHHKADSWHLACPHCSTIATLK